MRVSGTLSVWSDNNISVTIHVPPTSQNQLALQKIIPGYHHLQFLNQPSQFTIHLEVALL